MGHRNYGPRRDIEALLDATESVLVRAALHGGSAQREIAAEMETSKSRVNRLAQGTADAPSLLQNEATYAIASWMMPNPIVEVAAASLWGNGERLKAAITLEELSAAVAEDLDTSGASVRLLLGFRPTPGSPAAETLTGLLRGWSDFAFADLTPATDGTMIGVYVPRGPSEVASVLPRVPAATYTALGAFT